jgi:hypothetical protein
MRDVLLSSRSRHRSEVGGIYSQNSNALLREVHQGSARAIIETYSNTKTENIWTKVQPGISISEITHLASSSRRPQSDTNSYPIYVIAEA